MSRTPEIHVELDIVADVSADLGEGPIWDDQTDTLIFVDSAIGRIYRLDPATALHRSTDVGQEIGVAIPRQGGGLVVSARDGLLGLSDTEPVERLVSIEPGLDSRLNDAKCDSRGRLWSGTFSLSFERGAGSLYRIDPDLTVTKAFGDVSISNGLGWSPDEKIFYHTDTGRRGIDAFDYDIDTGKISNRRHFLDIDRSIGLPDGLTIDVEGCLWVALYRGGAVRRFSPEGECLGAVTVPTAQVTSCTFGGPDLDELYITTANQPDRAGARPMGDAGATYRCKPGVAGLPSHRFGG